MDRETSEENPYSSPLENPGGDEPGGDEPAVPQPAVVTWFYVYCVLMFLPYLGCSIIGIIFLVLDPDELGVDEPIEAKIIGGVYLILGVVFMIPYAVAPFLPVRKWSWIVCLVLICLGMTSVCCLPVTIPLLIFWIKPETRDYYAWSR